VQQYHPEATVMLGTAQSEIVPAQKSSGTRKAKRVLRLRRDHCMKTFLVLPAENPQTSTPSPSHSSQI